MDSISQFVLGAAVGEAVLGKKIGNRAILWGGIAGTIPDLDVFFIPFLDDPIRELAFHRGFSHSFVFAFLLAPILGWLFARWYQSRGRGTTFRDWTLLFLLGLGTHPILDSFTTWGTQLFLPFSDYRVAINSVFVADPLYTIPFLVCLIATMFVRRNKPLRRKLNYAGIIISCLYLSFNLVNKFRVEQVVKSELERQSIEYQRLTSAPTPLNAILWYAVVESEDGYHMGLYSLLDKNKAIDFEYFERQGDLIADIADTRIIDRLLWFTNGYYAVREADDELMFYDLRFGKIDLENRNGSTENRFIFPFRIYRDSTDNVTFSQIENRPERDEMNSAFIQLWDRMLGK